MREKGRQLASRQRVQGPIPVQRATLTGQLGVQDFCELSQASHAPGKPASSANNKPLVKWYFAGISTFCYHFAPELSGQVLVDTTMVDTQKKS